MTEILQYMQSLGAATGVVPPPSLFAIVVVDDGALGLLVNLFVIYCETCDVCDIYVTFVIYMWCW